MCIYTNIAWQCSAPSQSSDSSDQVQFKYVFCVYQKGTLATTLRLAVLSSAIINFTHWLGFNYREDDIAKPLISYFHLFMFSKLTLMSSKKEVKKSDYGINKMAVMNLSWQWNKIQNVMQTELGLNDMWLLVSFITRQDVYFLCIILFIIMSSFYQYNFEGFSTVALWRNYLSLIKYGR